MFEGVAPVGPPNARDAHVLEGRTVGVSTPLAVSTKPWHATIHRFVILPVDESAWQVLGVRTNKIYQGCSWEQRRNKGTKNVVSVSLRLFI